MRAKKIGLLALALVLALALTGAAFAKWSDTVRMEGKIETGNVKVGIANTWVNDPGTNWDPLYDAATKTTYWADKHVGSIESYTYDWKCTHGTEEYYQKIRTVVKNAYPGYAPAEEFTIANCGSIPVKVDLLLCDGNSWGPVCDDLNIVRFRVIHGATVLEATEASGGCTGAALSAAVLGVQLDHCDTMEVLVQLAVNQEAEQLSYCEWWAILGFSQWNEV